MKVSMDGLRRNLSGDVERLKRACEAVINSDTFYDGHLKESLKEAMNKVTQDSNVLNCVYSKLEPGFSDMSELGVDLLDDDPDDMNDE